MYFQIDFTIRFELVVYGIYGLFFQPIYYNSKNEVCIALHMFTDYATEESALYGELYKYIVEVFL